MPRFQSRLFNLIDSSLPVKLGRKARLWYAKATYHLGDRITEQLEQLKTRPQQAVEFLQLVGKQSTKILLYPIYALSQGAKRSYPQLGSSQAKLPLLLQPVQSLVLWFDSSALFDETQFGESQELSRLKSSLDKLEQVDKLAQLHKFLNLWQQRWEFLSKQNTNPSEQRLERLRHLIKAAIAYFFGKKPPIDQLNGKESEIWLSMEDLFGDDNGPWPAIADREATYIAHLPSYIPAEFSNLAKNPDSAISLITGKTPVNQLNKTVQKVESLENHSNQELDTNQKRQQNLSQEIASQTEQKLERFRHLIKAAIAYFFGKKPLVEKLDSSAPEAWLNATDLLIDDNEPWPTISDRESAYIAQLPSHVREEFSNLVKTSDAPNSLVNQQLQPSALSHDLLSVKLNALASSETSTSEIVAESERWLEETTDPPQTLQAWIETPAIFLGYVYSPVMQLIHWLDQTVASFEAWLVDQWQRFWRWLKKMLSLSRR